MYISLVSTRKDFSNKKSNIKFNAIQFKNYNDTFQSSKEVLKIELEKFTKNTNNANLIGAGRSARAYIFEKLPSFVMKEAHVKNETFEQEQNMASDYLTGSSIRQDYLQTAIEWICNKEMEIEDYMALHQHDSNSNELWIYFMSVINWVKTIFPKYRKEMKGVEWGYLYNQYKHDKLDTNALEKEITKLMQDDDVTAKKGIYEYLLSKNEKHLNIRAFTQSMKRETYEKQVGICPICKQRFEIEQMEADHITPWCEGGKTSAENCQMLCKECNRRKSNK